MSDVSDGQDVTRRDLEQRAGRRRRLYITGDTLYDEDLPAIRERFPDIDLAILHLGGTRILRLFLVTMDGRQGVDLLELIRPAAAIPVHYDDYSVFRSPLGDFEAEVERRRPPVRVHRPRRARRCHGNDPEAAPDARLLRGVRYTRRTLGRCDDDRVQRPGDGNGPGR